MPAAEPPPSAPGPRDSAAGAVTIRRLRTDDLVRVAALHRGAFPTNVVGRLGPRLLRVHLSTFVDSPHAVAWVAQDTAGHPVGFLVGVLDTARHRRHLRREHAARLGVAAAGGMLRHPRLACVLLVRRITLLRGRWRSRASTGVPPADGPPAGGPTAVLSHVAVAPHARGSGAGTALIERFEEAARASDAQRAALATLADERGAGSLYRVRGWILQRRRRTADGRDLELYELPVRTEDD